MLAFLRQPRRYVRPRAICGRLAEEPLEDGRHDDESGILLGKVARQIRLHEAGAHGVDDDLRPMDEAPEHIWG